MPYLFVEMEVRCGDYEFNSKSVTKLPENADQDYIDTFLEEKAQSFYGGTPSNYGDEWYYFGEVAVKIGKSELISEKEFEVLSKFL